MAVMLRVTLKPAQGCLARSKRDEPFSSLLLPRLSANFSLGRIEEENAVGFKPGAAFLFVGKFQFARDLAQAIVIFGLPFEGQAALGIIGGFSVR